MFGSRKARGVAGLACALALVLSGCGEEKRVPRLIGENVATAAARLEAADIPYVEVTADTIEDHERDNYEVCNTEPAAGGEVKERVMLIVRQSGTCE